MPSPSPRTPLAPAGPDKGQSTAHGDVTAHADAPAGHGDVPAVPQLGLRAVIAVWAAAALPMALLSWVGAPLLADQLPGPGSLGRALIITMTAGLIWQFALVLMLVRREQKTLRWSVVRDALWLRAPRSPRTGVRGGRAWLAIAPACVAFAAMQLVPSLPHPASRELAKFFGSRAGHALLAGSWGWFAVLVMSFAFNTILGEELLFRGYLLPRMSRLFGRGDWLANGVLFGAYHLHMPWAIPNSVIDGLVFAYPSKRYRSALIGIIAHSAQSLVFAGLALSLVLRG